MVGVLNMKTKLFIVFLLIFLVGCSSSNPLLVYETKEENACENNTIIVYNETIKYINDTIYINDTVCNDTSYINQTIYINESCRFEDDYVIDLIRRIKFLEGRYDDYTNLTLEYELEDCHDELSDCNETLEELRDLLD